MYINEQQFCCLLRAFNWITNWAKTEKLRIFLNQSINILLVRPYMSHLLILHPLYELMSHQSQIFVRFVYFWCRISKVDLAFFFLLPSCVYCNSSTIETKMGININWKVYFCITQHTSVADNFTKKSVIKKNIYIINHLNILHFNFFLIQWTELWVDY